MDSLIQYTACKLTKAILLEAQKQAALSFCSTEVALARAEARDLDLAAVEAWRASRNPAGNHSLESMKTLDPNLTVWWDEDVLEIFQHAWITLLSTCINIWNTEILEENNPHQGLQSQHLISKRWKVTAWKRGNGELAAKLEKEEWHQLHEEVGEHIFEYG